MPLPVAPAYGTILPSSLISEIIDGLAAKTWNLNMGGYNISNVGTLTTTNATISVATITTLGANLNCNSKNLNSVNNINCANVFFTGSLVGPAVSAISAGVDTSMNFGEGTGLDEYGALIWDNVNNKWCFYYGGRGNYMEFHSAGVIKMLLGGTLKTLSVDGSGFVKAT